MKPEYLLAVVLIVTAGTTPALAAANEAPLADAGLDQTVTRDTTVYLDATGSRDPDGVVERYDWTITAESGDTTNATAPQCRSCEQTQFRAEATGTYRVTLEVTDDEGATSSDTLYVTVEPGEGPSTTLVGPSRTTTAAQAEFTVDTDSGAAPLDQIVWTQDGNRVATEPASGDADTSKRSLHFPTNGSHDVAVVVIDEDGQRDTASTSIAVTKPLDTTAPSGTSGSSSGSSSSSRSLTETPPTIRGPKVVTGHGELSAEYHLSDDATGTWIQNSQRVDQGASSTRSFSPGVHQLYATTTAGTATFPDGSRTVVADPAPRLPVVEVENGSVVSLDVQATDDFGNLHSLAISVDGDTVRTVATENVQSERTGNKLSTVERLRDIEPGTHTVSVSARDARGQVKSATRTVEVPGPPEVHSAGFVQDGPLDQYHPRIDESRYTATYRVVVGLNGVEPDTIGSEIFVQNDDWTSNIDRHFNQEDDRLVIERESYKDGLSSVRAHSRIGWTNNQWGVRVNSDSIDVTPAPPEIRIEVVTPQANNELRDGAQLDASDSFDPDGTRLDYDWYGVTGGHVEKPVVTLDSYDIARLDVIDKDEQKSSEQRLLEWYAPELASVSIEGSGPFYPNETVRFSISSEIFHYSKWTYEESTSFSLRIEEGRVVGHELLRETDSELDGPDAETRSREHRWTVEVPARAFMNQSDSLKVASYPTEHPEVGYELPLPEPSMYILKKSEFRDISTDIEYLVERPEYAVRRTADVTSRDVLLEDGYEVRKKTKSGRKYHLEKRVKVQDAEYDVDTEKFRQPGLRDFYLEENPSWEAAGTEEEISTWTTTERVWHSDLSGPGEFTGNTRDELVESGVYRTEKQFQYETTHTYETTETYQDTYTTTETSIGYETKCTAFGCFEYQTTVTETEHHTVTRTRTVTQTRTVENTYWSAHARSPSHEYTGRSRRITLEEPEYERQYEFQVEQLHRDEERYYLAERRVKVQPATYEWREQEVVSSRARAESAAIAPDVRIGESSPAYEWTLEKRIGTEETTVRYVEPDWQVIQASGERNATWVREYVRSDGKMSAVVEKRTEQVSASFNYPRFISSELIINTLKEKMEKQHA